MEQIHIVSEAQEVTGQEQIDGGKLSAGSEILVQINRLQRYLLVEIS